MTSSRLRTFVALLLLSTLFSQMTSACTSAISSPAGDEAAQPGMETAAEVGVEDQSEPAGNEAQRTRLGFGTINDAASNPDGTALVLGGSLGVYVIDTSTQEQLHHFQDHEAIVTSVDWSPDGKEIISAAEDGLAIVWDVSHGEMASMHQFPDEVFSLHWSPVGSVVAVESTLDKWESGGNVVFIWDTKSGDIVHTLSKEESGQEPFGTECIEWSPDGETLALCDYEGSVMLWNAISGRLLRSLSGPLTENLIKGVMDVSWSADGTILAIGWREGMPGMSSVSDINQVMFWDAESGALLNTLPDNQGPKSAWSLSGDMLATAYGDEVTLWDAQSGLQLGTPFLLSDSVEKLAWTTQGNTLMMLLHDQSVMLWDASSGEQVFTFEQFMKWDMENVRWSPDQTKIAVLNTGEIIVWDIEAREIESVLGEESVSCMDWSPSVERIAYASAGDILLWDPSNPANVQRLVEASFTFSDIAWSPDGETIAGTMEEWEFYGMSADLKNLEVVIWDGDSGERITTLDPAPYTKENGRTAQLNPLAWSPDGSYIAAGSWSTEVIIWDANTGAHVASFQGHDYNVNRVAWSPDGLSLASGAWDNTIAIWDVHSGERKLVLEGHKDYIKALAWSYDGETLAAGSADSVYLWDPISGVLLDTLDDHMDSVMDIAWTLDGGFLASASRDGSVRLWEME